MIFIFIGQYWRPGYFIMPHHMFILDQRASIYFTLFCEELEHIYIFNNMHVIAINVAEIMAIIVLVLFDSYCTKIASNFKWSIMPPATLYF